MLSTASIPGARNQDSVRSGPLRRVPGIEVVRRRPEVQLLVPSRQALRKISMAILLRVTAIIALRGAANPPSCARSPHER